MSNFRIVAIVAVIGAAYYLTKNDVPSGKTKLHYELDYKWSQRSQPIHWKGAKYTFCIVPGVVDGKDAQTRAQNTAASYLGSLQAKHPHLMYQEISLKQTGKC